MRWAAFVAIVVGAGCGSGKSAPSGQSELDRLTPLLEKDPKIAADPKVKACLAPAPSACAEVAVALGGGSLTGKEEPEARVGAFAVGCRAGDPHLCGELANSLAQGYGVAKDVPLAAKLFEQACEAKDGVSCALLGRMYKRGDDGIVKDEDKAKALWEKGCAMHDKVSCTSLAPRHHGPTPVH
jgi:uncharacterized protein